MLRLQFCVLLVISVAFMHCDGQEYDFAAEMTRQCLVPDPVGLLDCVENKVTLPYMTSWVECTNSLGQNVKTSTDIINYRCKSVWEGKGLIPEVFYIKDCVIEKTGLPAKNVSAEVLGAYKECENNAPNTQQQRIKTAPVQQQQVRTSSVEYTPVTQIRAPTVQSFQQPAQAPVPSQSQNFAPRQQFQAPAPPPIQSQVPVTIQGPIQQVFQAPAPGTVQSQFQAPASRPVQSQFQAPVPRPVQSQFQAPAPRPVQSQFQAPAPRQVQSQFQAPASRPLQTQFQAPAARPVQQQFQAPRPIQQSPVTIQGPGQQQFMTPAPRPVQQQIPVTFQQQFQAPSQRPAQQVPVTTSGTQYQAPSTRSQYPSMMPAAPGGQRQPYSQQYFAIYPQAPLPNQQYSVNQPVLSRKTATNQPFLSQQQMESSRQMSILSSAPSTPYTYSFQINHPQRPVF